jgi:hypothetical protein
LTGLSISAQTQQSQVTSDPAQATKQGTISGRVVNESGQPLPNATVLVRSFGALRPEQTTSTDREGRFQVSGLEPVSYQVTAFLSAYTSLLRTDNTQGNNYRIGDSVRLVMIKGGVITGTVTTQTGEPVVGVRVRASVSGNRSGATPVVPERMTDDRGVYRIYGLPPGTYVVWAGGGGGAYYGPDPYDIDVPTYAPASSRDTAAEITVRPARKPITLTFVTAANRDASSAVR